GAEMFEADDQITLNEYLAGKINYKTFKQEAKVWPNNTTDYQPLVDFAKDNNLSFVAANVPRRYANMVYKNGFEALEDVDKFAKKNWMAPLPIKYDPDLPGYKKMIEMMGGHGGDNLPKAQALKDATMAYFITENWKKGKIFIHYNGTYHSDNHEGIMWYLQQKNKKLNILTISTVEQTEVSNLTDENKNKADFIIAVPEDMTKTH
ncbi:MAG TPA: iron-regulated protein, partial [Flavobacteriales bacterium]|nr:iron-regulated protein [Flavobacteriales bacterium]